MNIILAMQSNRQHCKETSVDVNKQTIFVYNPIMWYNFTVTVDVRAKNAYTQRRVTATINMRSDFLARILQSWAQHRTPSTDLFH